MDPNLSTTEPDSDYLSQTSFLFENYPIPGNFLLHTPETSKQILFKKPSSNPNQRFVILLRNLICEQMAYRFDRSINLCETNSKVCNQFKFFLNTLEIICHCLGIIKTENYTYRLKDHGYYQKHITGFPRKFEAGSIVTLQTYSSTLTNTVLNRLKTKFKGLSRKDEIEKRLYSYCQEYAYCAAQYHLRLNSIFKELTRLGFILEDIYSDWRQENQKLNSIVFLEGIWHPEKKVLFTSDIIEMLKSFEVSIRDFEQALIKCTINLIDFEAKESKAYKLPFSDLKTEGSSSQFICYETPTNDLKTQYRPLKTGESKVSYTQNITQLLSEPATIIKSPRFGKDKYYHKALNPLSENNTPNLHLVKQEGYGLSSSKAQSTLPTISEMSSKDLVRSEIEVKPWGENQALDIKNLQPKMTPVDIKKNFSFKNLDTSLKKGIMNQEAFSNVYNKCSQIIKVDSSSKGQVASSNKLKETGMRRYSGKVYFSKEKEDFNLLKPKVYEGKSDNGFKRVIKERTEQGRYEEKSDQIKKLFQQSNFYKGKMGTSSRLLKFR